MLSRNAPPQIACWCLGDFLLLAGRHGALRPLCSSQDPPWFFESMPIRGKSPRLRSFRESVKIAPYRRSVGASCSLALRSGSPQRFRHQRSRRVYPPTRSLRYTSFEAGIEGAPTKAFQGSSNLIFCRISERRARRQRGMTEYACQSAHILEIPEAALAVNSHSVESTMRSTRPMS